MLDGMVTSVITGVARTCNGQDGNCIKCKENYTGDYCETYEESCSKPSEEQKSQESASIPLAAILVPVFAVLIIIIIIIITVTVYRRRRKRHRRSRQEETLLYSRNTTAPQTQDTTLIVACKEGNVHSARGILNQNPEDINKKGQHGLTAVMWAARRGHREAVDLLVQEGADMSLEDYVGNNILHWACYGGHMAMVKHVTTNNIVDINRKGQDGRTPLMWAARDRHLNMFNLLVSKGGLQSEVDNDGNNILLLACCGGNVKIVKYILSHKTVDINGRGHSGSTPLTVAAYRGNEEVVDLLVNEGADLTLADDVRNNFLHTACLGGHLDIVRRVLDKVDINKQGQYSRTPLMMAARRGEREIFDLLVSEGPDTSPIDDDGNNILHLASKGGHLKIVKYVLNKNMVDINVRNKRNETATMLAPRGTEVCHQLVTLGGHVE